MAEQRHERLVAAPPAAVWKVLAEFDRIAEWADNVDHSSFMTEQTEGVGSTRRVSASGLVVLERVTAWEPEAKLAYELVGLPPVIAAATNTWELSADGAGTRVALTVDITPGPRPPMRLAARAIARRFGGINESMMAGLARRVEGVST